MYLLKIPSHFRLPYTEAVIMEVQRRTNIPPLGISHRAICDTEIFGYKIPEGTIVLPSLYSIHMDPKYWKDPLAFRPERFLDSNKKITTNEKYFAPFGYGSTTYKIFTFLYLPVYFFR